MSGDGEDKQVTLKRLERNARGELRAHLAGGDGAVEKVKIARCFPWTLRDEYVSVRDGEGKEVVLLKTLDELDAATRKLIEQELAENVFVPQIRRIVKYEDEFGVISIAAETDRGEVKFQMRNRQDVRALTPTRAIFRDVDGNLYEVPDFNALDRGSQKYIEQFF